MEKNASAQNAEGDKGKGVVNGDGQQHEKRLPRFLTVVYDIMDDEETNSIISWNSAGTGFVIWDHIKFLCKILPTHFVHNNFASFVYQLNNYGFSKISYERREYANQWFQAGKKDLLKNIKGRNQQKSKVSKNSANCNPDHVSTYDAIKRKMDTIISEQNEMKVKIQELRQSVENVSAQFGQFLAQFLRNNKDDEASGDNSKRPRMDVKKKSAEKDVEICQFWTKMLEDGDANEEEGDLAARHAEAIMELDEMMESRIEMQKLVMSTKLSDNEGEEDGSLELWT